MVARKRPLIVTKSVTKPQIPCFAREIGVKLPICLMITCACCGWSVISTPMGLSARTVGVPIAAYFVARVTMMLTA
jgi:hypothetical protein